MPAVSPFHILLSRPNTLSFPSNRAYAENLEAAGGRVIQCQSGHHVLYGRHGRRLLLADPAGNPLHECEWNEVSGSTTLSRARVWLDWDRWVGIKPQGLVSTMTLDLSRKSGWERLRPDDLRQMAAHAMQVPIDEVRFFYDDRDLVID